MSVSRWFSMLVVMVALPAMATRAEARRNGARGGHPGPADEPQMRDLLAKLAAASGEPAPEERTDADLMYEAMLRWNGEPPDSAAIDRALAQSKRDAARVKQATREKVRHMFWKDPFADDPRRLIPVLQEDRDLLDAYARKTRRTEPRDELSRLRAELAAARQDAASARADNERLRERAESVSQRQGCVADASVSGEVRKRRRAGGGEFRRRHSERARTQIALTSTAPASEPVMASEAPPAPPPAHGIIIVPLPSPPPPPVVEARRRPGSRYSAR